ncbi:MAG: M24 family metallopeptidase [Tepidisphaeraceae bacterium]
MKEEAVTESPIVSRAKAYLKVRHKTIRDAMKELKLDGLLLTHPADLTYFTNFTGEDSIGLMTADDLYIITDFRYKEQVAIEAGWLKMVVRDGKMSDAVVKPIVDAGCRRIGFEANFTSFGQADQLDRALKQKFKGDSQPEPELVPLQDVLLNLRKVKDDHETDLIRKAVNIAEEAFEAIRDEIKVGQTEGYLAGLLIMELRSRGASDSSFPPIVAAGANSSLPHYRPAEVLVQKDQPLLFDWGARYKSYCSDLTRTFTLGRVSPRIKQIYKVVHDAQRTAIAFLRPGVTTGQADAVARDVIARAGFADYFGHGLGHGIGLDIHELPTMRKSGGDEELRPGMIVTVEPGIYLPGEGGVRIEDDVLITHSGCEVLSSLDSSFEACHID